MTTVRTIIKDAYRESNLVPESQELTASQYFEGLRLFNRFVRSVVYNELGTPLKTLNIGDNNVGYDYYESVPDYQEQFTDNYFVPRNVRLVLNLEGPKTLRLHPRPLDGTILEVSDASGNLSTNALTLEGNGRRIEGELSIVLNEDETNRTWFYREDTSSWARISELTDSDNFPFPSASEEYFVLGLAMRLNPRNGSQMSPESFDLFRRGRSQFRSRYLQVQNEPSEQGLLRLTSNKRYRQDGNEDVYFDKGFMI